VGFEKGKCWELQSQLRTSGPKPRKMLALGQLVIDRLLAIVLEKP
jgi:hypothetical protein